MVALVLVADAGFGEGRHAGMAGQRRLHQADRHRSPRGLAQAHVEFEQRPFAQAFQQPAMAASSRPPTPHKTRSGSAEPLAATPFATTSTLRCQT